MKAEVQWKSRLSFTGTADSGFEVDLGTYPEVGGDDDGFRPMELMALSLAGCTAMDVISILEKKRQEILDFQVKVLADRTDKHPKVFTKAVIEYHAAGNGISESAVRRAIELSADAYCPAQAMLGKIIPLGLRYFIYEGDDLSSAVLATEGVVNPTEGQY
jgi:putative redox protein